MKLPHIWPSDQGFSSSIGAAEKLCPKNVENEPAHDERREGSSTAATPMIATTEEPNSPIKYHGFPLVVIEKIWRRSVQQNRAMKAWNGAAE